MHSKTMAKIAINEALQWTWATYFCCQESRCTVCSGRPHCGRL